MQIGKCWLGVIGLVFVTFLAACYDDNGNSTSSGTTGTPSTNSVAPASITNRVFTLQYSSPVIPLENLQLLSDNTFVRSPAITAGLQSSGTFSPPTLSGNVWTTLLTTTSTNGISTNLVGPQTLALTFTSSSSGTFTLTGGGVAVSNGSFSSVATALNLPARFPGVDRSVQPLFAEITLQAKFLRGMGACASPEQMSALPVPAQVAEVRRST